MQIQGHCNDKFISVKNIFQSFFDKKEELGANLTVIKDGETLINLYGGTKNENNDKWESETTVNTFSLSKGIYAGCIALLINSNDLDIEKNISFYWPEFTKKNKQNIKVKHLLSHQSGLYRFREKVTNEDLLHWDKIVNILENQEPDHLAGNQTFYHAKTHGYLVGQLIKKITNLNIDDFFRKEISKPFKINFDFGLQEMDLKNVADLKEEKNENTLIKKEFDAFNNPQHDIQFYNSIKWRTSLVPSMGGHGSAFGVAKFYDILANDIKKSKNIIISKAKLLKILEQSTDKKDGSLGLPIRWTYSGFILRGGWMFGKNKESFGHNGWGGSLGFADPIEGIGLAYTTRKINSGMSADHRAVKLIKEIYNCI
jgi:CubicO group peptidase (beta-lactamase class C family)